MNVLRQPVREVRNMSRKVLVLWRAAADPYVSVQTSLAEERWCAEEYLGNGAFGGPTLYRAKVVIDDDRVLDLTGPRFWARLSKAIGRKLDPASYGYQEAQAVANDSDIAEELEAAGYHWVRFEDDFPDGCVTWLPQSLEASDATEEAMKKLRKPAAKKGSR